MVPLTVGRAGLRIGLDEALDLTRTGGVWVFRGHTAADGAIQLTTNIAR